MHQIIANLRAMGFTVTMPGNYTTAIVSFDGDDVIAREDITPLLSHEDWNSIRRITQLPARDENTFACVKIEFQ